MKIYIIGSPGTGKTTLATKIGRIYKVPVYELDNIVYDDSKKRKCSEEEIQKKFQKILEEENWVIEDVGRKIFEQGRIQSDTIYFLNIKKSELCFRVIKRWMKQKLKLEPYNYKPTIKGLIEMLEWTRNYPKEQKIKELEPLKDKVKILTKKEINHWNKELEIEKNRREK